MVNTDFLSHCKKNVTLINTGRGALIHEADLAQWLSANPSAHAGLDVSPPSHHHRTIHSSAILKPALRRTSPGRPLKHASRHEVTTNIQAWINGETRNRVE